MTQKTPKQLRAHSERDEEAQAIPTSPTRVSTQIAPNHPAPPSPDAIPWRPSGIHIGAKEHAAGKTFPALNCSPINPDGGPCFRRRRWGIVLAGGDGTRLRTLTHFISGDERPKQFCPLYDGGVSLLEQTRQRMLRSIYPGQTLFSLNRSHRRFYAGQLAGQASQCIVQPANRGTAPPILHSLLSIAGADPEAVVAITPCDHYYSDESQFTDKVETALELATEQPGLLVLLAAKPDRPEVEYGWIETASPAEDDKEDLLRVRAFHEKPPAALAEVLFRQGSLWNTFVMIGGVDAFLSMIETARPDLVKSMSRIPLWTGKEVEIETHEYDRVPSTDFSREILTPNPGRLTAIGLGPIGWSDLGDPGRTLAALSGTGREPGWVGRWRLTKLALQSSAASAA